MKIKKLIIDNVGKIEHAEIEFDHPLLLFYGEILQGKTTILNAVRWCFGGSFPQDIIRHGAKDADVTLELDNGSISRSWYKAKDGSTKARPITFVRDGKPVKEPTREIEKFLNPFLLDQDFLRKMGEAERKAYFTTLFAVDTSDIDRQIYTASEKAKGLREKLKGYGDIDTTEVKPIDTKVVQQQLQDIKNTHSRRMDDWNRACLESTNRTIARSTTESKLNDIIKEIQLLTERYEIAERLRVQYKTWLQDNQPIPVDAQPSEPDISTLEAVISNAAANQVRVEQYQKNLERARLQTADIQTLTELEGAQRELKAKKISTLSKINETHGIKDLTFGDAGNFAYQNTMAGMLSGSQIMHLSAELSRLYPEGLGVGLIDRGESLGKSIFGLIDLAKEKDETILVTVVGESPAEVPENIGVFVVEDGVVHASPAETAVSTQILPTLLPSSAQSEDVWND